MDYGRLLQDAWRLTWRHRFLWVLGLIAGGQSCNFNFGSGGSPGGYPSGSRDPTGIPPEMQRVMADLLAWATANVGLLIALGILLALLTLASFVVHFIAKGGLIGSMARLTAGEDLSLGSAWALGRGLAWRYVRLWLLLSGVTLLVVLGIGIIVALLVGVGQASPGLAIGLGVLLGGLVVLAGIPLAIGAFVALSYAERAIAIDELGARASVARGVQLLFDRLGPSLLLGLVFLGVAIGMAILVGIVAVILLIPLGLAVLGAYLAWGISNGTMVVVGAALLVLLGALWAVSAVLNTYTAAYWTLGYLALTDRYSTEPPGRVTGTTL
jgi:hypothetical protein